MADTIPEFDDEYFRRAEKAREARERQKKDYEDIGGVFRNLNKEAKIGRAHV